MKTISAIKGTARVLLLSAVVFLASCERVIDLDLSKTEKKYVIEAVITDQPGTAKVRLTQTKDFDENNDFPGVTGAAVSIGETGGPTVAFVETSPGVYEAASFAGAEGKRYELLVTIGINTFSAVSTLPQRVSFDSLFVTDEFLFTETRKIASTVFTDPAGRGNNYRFIQYVNGRKEEQIMVMNDDYTDGRTISSKLYYFPEEDNDASVIDSGDTVRVEMQSIDAAMYRYWYSLARSATGGSGQATPANPVSNIQGGALGYFSAHTLQSRSLIVP